MTGSELWTARNRLRDAVAILARPPDAQQEWLRSIGTFPLADELAIEFDDWAGLLPKFERDGLVDEASAGAVREVAAALDQLQDEFGESEDAWIASKLAASPMWEAVRRAAGHALVAFVIHDSAGVTARAG